MYWFSDTTDIDVDEMVDIYLSDLEELLDEDSLIELCLRFGITTIDETSFERINDKRFRFDTNISVSDHDIEIGLSLNDIAEKLDDASYEDLGMKMGLRSDIYSKMNIVSLDDYYRAELLGKAFNKISTAKLEEILNPLLENN